MRILSLLLGCAPPFIAGDKRLSLTILSAAFQSSAGGTDSEAPALRKK